MANKRKPTKVKKMRRRVKPAEPSSKLVLHYVTMNEVYRAARAAGFTDQKAYWLATDKDSYPDWVIPTDPNKKVIPNIDPDDGDLD